MATLLQISSMSDWLSFSEGYYFLHNKIQVLDQRNNLHGLWESLIDFLLSLSQAVQLQLIFS